MRLNLRLCVSLALFSTCFSSASYADRFNNVIDDFDTYLQSENEGQKSKPRPIEVPLSVKSQAQGYDVLSTLSPVPLPKENRQVKTVNARNTKEKKATQHVSNTVTVSHSQNTTAPVTATVQTQVEPKIQPQVTEPVTPPVTEVCVLPTEPSSYQPTSSYLLQSNQWNPKYLAKDFAKYQVIIDPLGLYSSDFTKKAGADNAAYLAQLANLIEQQQLKSLYRLGIAQGVGELIAYNKLLTDGQLVNKLTNYNKSIAELNRIIAEKQSTINQLSEEITANKLKIDQLQNVVKSVDNKVVIDELNNELTKSKGAVAEKQASLEALAKQNDQSLETIKKLEKQLNDGLVDVANTKKQLTEKDKQVTDAHQRIDQLTAEIAKLQSDAKQQLQSSGNTDEQLKTLSANLLTQETLLKQREDELKQVQSQKNDVQSALKQQQDAVKQLEQQNQQLAEKSKQNEKIQVVLAEQTAQLVQKNALEVELANAKKQQLTQQNAHEKIAKQLTDSQNQYAQLQAQLATNEQGYAEAKKQLAQANAEVQKLRTELEKQTELAGKATDQQVKELTTELNQQITLLKAREETLTKLDLENKNVQNSLKAQLSDKQQLESQNALLASQAKEIQIAKLEKDIASRNQQQSDLEQKLLDVNKQLNVLKLEAEKFTAESVAKKDQELLQLKKQLDEKTAADSQSRQELASVQENLKKAKDELASLKAFSTDDGLKLQIRDLNQRVTQLREENDALRANKKTVAGKAPNIIQIPPADNTTIAKENAKRNQKILEDIKQQKYSKLDNFTYYKVLQKGTPITDVQDKKITLIMREQLTDGKVTVMHTEKNPMVLPYNQLPPPMNSFVEKVGVGGMVKIYIEPEGGYGPEGIPGEVPPNSMSIIDLKVIQAN
ncbi:FKBP-type peptidyl-prolyl cis-trans isomerase [Providencia alcalifaciens]|uniref:peptidylprolyl isomerase n=1 Tax=Providencia alcalifaciens 205/92 TaxID=1256988 RepID=A0AAV3M075_9GAMM|nr:FKBP-type peptidyl-prolyl cis-trans isomerase [Providencia alcalifaciens]EUD09069.1 hypothetical protein HMPREF1563_3701 [Providencia alcalifaciens 205/92]